MSRKVIRHGTRNTYERHGCRCDECRAANTARHHAWVTNNRERNREIGRESYQRNAEALREKKREERDPVKTFAHNKVRLAIRTGEMVRGSDCEIGGDCSGPIDAHHDDHSRPLDVRWLCRRHHKLVDLGSLA